MGKLFFIIVFISVVFIHNGNCQQIDLSATTGIYEYSHVIDFEKTIDERIKVFDDNLKQLNYSNISLSEKEIKGENFFTKMIFGSAMEIHYNVYIKFKVGKYKLLINSFIIHDQRFGSVPLEQLKKKSQKRWAKYINEKLPAIIKNIENTKQEADW